MANARYYSSIAAVTNLQTTAGPGDATIQVASSVGFPNSFPFELTLDYGSSNSEIVLVTAGGPSVFNVTRAYDGTSATTHNAGAVVRHTSSAIDFTDSRTHEASTSGVHGITGAFVDTLSAQTLQNKTLSAPVINNGTVTGSVTATGATVSNGTFSAPTINNPTVGGTVAGNPTFSGTPTFSATPVFNLGETVSGAAVASTRTLGTNSAFTARVTGDTNDRFTARADGTIAWSSGATTPDTTLARSGAGALALTGSLAVSGSAAVTGDVSSTGDVTWTGADWTSYTPTWAATTTNPVLGFGGILNGRYKQLGKTVVLEIALTQGSAGASQGSGTYSFSLPVTANGATASYLGQFSILNNAATSRFIGQAVILTGGTVMNLFVPEISGGNATGKAVSWTNTVPISFSSGDQARVTITYQAA